MTISDITNHMIVSGYLEPLTIGTRHEIYKKTFSTSLMEEIVQTSSSAVKLWNGNLKELVGLILNWSENDELYIFREIVHDCSFSEIQHLVRSEEPSAILKEMYWLQTSGISDSPVIRIGLLHSGFQWLIGFENASGFEIAFYGSESLWNDFKSFVGIET